MLNVIIGMYASHKLLRRLIRKIYVNDLQHRSLTLGIVPHQEKKFEHAYFNICVKYFYTYRLNHAPLKYYTYYTTHTKTEMLND